MRCRSSNSRWPYQSQRAPPFPIKVPPQRSRLRVVLFQLHPGEDALAQSRQPLAEPPQPYFHLVQLRSQPPGGSVQGGGAGQQRHGSPRGLLGPVGAFQKRRGRKGEGRPVEERRRRRRRSAQREIGRPAKSLPETAGSRQLQIC